QIIYPTTGVDGLDVSYKGTKLRTLSKTTFLVENTGNSPVLESDVIAPIKIVISDKANVLDTMIDSKLPTNLEFQAIRDKQEIFIKF
ncbi:hypothetical protein, partial [Nitrosococcus oceani]